MFAAGDCIGGVMLAHTASYEALQAVEGMFDSSFTPLQPHFVPGCTYCHPQVASVGKRERELKEAGVDYKVGKFSFQAIGKALPSVMLSLTRQVFCLIPLFWGFSLIGLDYAWIAFPAAELITGAVGVVLYFRQTARWKRELPPRASGQERVQGAAG